MEQRHYSLFTVKYWKEAASTAMQLRVVVVASLFIAVRIAIATLYIPIGTELRVTFGFFVNAFGAHIYGPVLAPVSGFITDIVSYFLRPMGAFFPGYTLTAMAGSFVYAIFLFRRRITVLRLAATKLFVNLFVNVGMNSLWSAILYSRGFYYYFTTRLIKNIVLLPIEVFVLVVFFRAMTPVAKRLGLLPEQAATAIPFW